VPLSQPETEALLATFGVNAIPIDHADKLSAAIVQ
jgi:hypothetical protein